MTLETAEILEQLREEIRGMASPWFDRVGAAAYLRTSVSEIDKAANEGRLKKGYLIGSPRFHRDDLDALVSDTKKPLRIDQRKAA